MKAIIRLIDCVRVLGLSHGLKYWRIENACIIDPSMVMRWAIRCEREAKACRMRGDNHGAQMMSGWAKELRKSWAKHILGSA